MGDTVATTENGYDRVRRIEQTISLAVVAMDDLADGFTDDDPALILTALCADGVALGARLTVFARQYKGELECISIDQ